LSLGLSQYPKHLCLVGHWIHNWPTLTFESSPGRLTSHLLSGQSRSILSTICTHIGATRILRKRIRLAIILHDRFSSAQIGFMFLCYSWHHVLDTGLFMVSRRHVQRNLDPRRSCPFDHRVTQQFFFLVLAVAHVRPQLSALRIPLFARITFTSRLA
jgi:hypothetical protein